VIKDAWVLDNTFGDVFNDTPQQNGRLNVTANQYDGQDRLTLATAPEGGTFGYTYSADLLRNVIQVTQTQKPGFPPPTSLTTTYAYDPVYNRPTSITDPLGLVTTALCDRATGNLASTIADTGSAPHLNATSNFTDNGFGQILTATDPLQTVTLDGYDSFGNRTSIMRDYRPNRLNQRTTMGYAALGDVGSVTDPNGHVATSTYDANRRIATVTTPATSAMPNGLVTTCTYDPASRARLRSRSRTILLTLFVAKCRGRPLALACCWRARRWSRA
jgi:YD repeat-containing protein